MQSPGSWTLQQQQSGRSRYASSHTANTGFSPAGPGLKSGLSKSYVADERAGTFVRSTSSLASRSMTTPNVNASVANSMLPASASATMPNLTKLHKRGSGSGSTTRPSISTEPFPDIVTPIHSSPVTKVKPYLRKLSSAKDEQGRIDLSKSLAENDRLGLGIQEYSTRSTGDSIYPPAGRSHTRTTSVGSQMSTSSAHRQQPFVHPMRQAPRPYTPPVTRSHASSPHGDDDDDDDDFAVEEDVRPGFAFRTRRSMSNSSQQHAPTPLSQTVTAADIGTIPRLTSTSQSNLSIVSTRSSKPTGSRRNTGRSQELAISPSSRTSFDRPFGPRRSDTEAQSRDERIAAARRKFQEKEALKDRKAEKEAQKRQDAEQAKALRKQQRDRRRSDASADRIRIQRPSTARTGSALGLNSPIMAYEEPQPSEKLPVQTRVASTKDNGSFFSKLFSCSGRRK